MMDDWTPDTSHLRRVIAPAEQAGIAAFREGRWANPYEKRRGYEFEAWQWDLGWRLARHMRDCGK